MLEPNVSHAALADIIMRDALAGSISSGSFIDTEYYLFSRRMPDGAVGHLRTVYASSAVLKASSAHFAARTSFTQADRG